jgi:hypothetical protein
VRARKEQLRLTGELARDSPQRFVDLIRQKLNSADDEAAISCLELLAEGDQRLFVEDLVQYFAEGRRWAYRCLAILRAIESADALTRIERRSVELLDAEPDYYMYLQLAALLSEFLPASAGLPLARAEQGSRPDDNEAAAFLRSDR